MAEQADRLESVRNFFPAEATAAYISLIGILNANHIGPSAYDYQMLAVIGGLILVNAWIYFKFRGLKHPALHLLLAVGFVLWSFNTDIPRFRDVELIGPYVELAAPIGLIFYTLITSFVSLPPKQDGGH